MADASDLFARQMYTAQLKFGEIGQRAFGPGIGPGLWIVAIETGPNAVRQDGRNRANIVAHDQQIDPDQAHTG